MYESISDEPDVPQNVMIEENPDSDSTDDHCTLHVQVDPPNNINPRHIDCYRVEYPSGSRNISGVAGSGQISVPDCTPDLRLNVTAIVCDNRSGAVASDIEPKYMVVPTTVPPTDVSSGLSIGSFALP